MTTNINSELAKVSFSPSDKELSLFLSCLFQSYYPLIKLINSRYRSHSGLKPTALKYLCLLYSFPDGLTVNEIKEISNTSGNIHYTLKRLIRLGYLSRKKGKIRGSYNLTPDTYYLTLSGRAVVESILDSIKR